MFIITEDLLYYNSIIITLKETCNNFDQEPRTLICNCKYRNALFLLINVLNKFINIEKKPISEVDVYIGSNPIRGF